MASNDDEACPSTKRMKLDIPTECDTLRSINAQFPKIDNLECFPAEILHHIFFKVNDTDLLNVSDSSCRFNSIVSIVFKHKYVNKYFVFDDDSKQEMYEELFSRFGRYAVVKAIEVKNIRDITENHWLPQLLRQYANRLQKLTFIACTVKEIRNILSEHMNVNHLVLRSVHNNARFNLPDYRNLKKLELCQVRGYHFDNLAQTIQNNPALESLILENYRFTSDAFTLHDAMMTIAQNSMFLQHLAELDLNFPEGDLRISDEDMDSIIDSLKSLQSLKLTINDSYLELIQRLGLACKQLKHLALKPYKRYNNFSDAMIDALGRFTAIERLELRQGRYNHRIESVVGQMPNLRQLNLQMNIPDSSTFILSLLRNCPSIETIELHTHHDERRTYFVNAQFWAEFNEVMQHPNGKFEVKRNEKFVGYVTKKEIVWMNTVMHWFEYEWEFNKTNVTLLDLATPSAASVGAKAEPKPSPFNHILGYLDLASLYSMSAASEHSKQLVEDYVKRHAQQNGTFTISDQFHHDAKGLVAFAEHVENLKVHISHLYFCDRLDAISEHYTKLRKLSIHLRWSEYSYKKSRYIFPQVHHLIVDGHCADLRAILHLYPKLETLEIKSSFSFFDTCLEPLATICNLKKFTFKYRTQNTLEIVRRNFEESSTELIPINYGI